MADTKAQRDQLIDQLVALTNQWATQATNDINNRVTFLTRVLQGRGAGQLLNSNQAAANQLVVTSINQFLTGSQ